MPIYRRLRSYVGSKSDGDTPAKITDAMNGTKSNKWSGHGPALEVGEVIKAVVYEDGQWFVFTEQHIMDGAKP